MSLEEPFNTVDKLESSLHNTISIHYLNTAVNNLQANFVQFLLVFQTFQTSMVIPEEMDFRVYKAYGNKWILYT